MELVLFYTASTIALVATILALTRANATHALIYLILSLLAVAVVFYVIGAPFAAALEVVIYAGAIMVLFIFVIMMLNLGDKGDRREKQLLKPQVWIVPVIFTLVLLVELVLVLSQSTPAEIQGLVTPKQVGLTLFGPYVLAVEIASMLLLAGLVGSFHLGRRYLDEGRENSSRGRS
ncbi:MAG: NADH-quinone oxidoreductase subunit J [Porticoccaceae bacterium]|nr:MAG: NADH-quinone oxidoreductase subunit J [Porticoccaceae bacterium]